MTVELDDLPSQPAGGKSTVELGLDDHPAAGQAQTPAKYNTAASSARRQHVRPKGRRLSSSLTMPVTAAIDNQLLPGQPDRTLRSAAPTLRNTRRPQARLLQGDRAVEQGQDFATWPATGRLGM